MTTSIYPKYVNEWKTHLPIDHRSMSISLCICRRLPGSHVYQLCSRDPDKEPRVDKERKRGLILAPCLKLSSLRRRDTPIKYIYIYIYIYNSFQNDLFANNYIIVREQFAKSWEVVTLANSLANNSRTVHEHCSPYWAKKGVGRTVSRTIRELFMNNVRRGGKIDHLANSSANNSRVVHEHCSSYWAKKGFRRRDREMSVNCIR